MIEKNKSRLSDTHKEYIKKSKLLTLVPVDTLHDIRLAWVAISHRNIVFSAWCWEHLESDSILEIH